MNCPACQSFKMSSVGNLQLLDFDGSIFNFNADFRECKSCGFCRVLSDLSDSIIAQHYAEESLYSILTGVGVGGETKEDIERYKYYEALLIESQVDFNNLADIGCSKGGFLKFLRKYYPNLKLKGIDIDETSLVTLSNTGIETSNGSVFDLPLEDSSQNLISYFHVLEHVLNVDSLLNEASRVLKYTGYIFIEVPDAQNYRKEQNRVGACFWLAMKEHVNHFSPRSIQEFFCRHSFNIKNTWRSSLPMKNGKNYPSLIILAQKEKDSNLISKNCNIGTIKSEFADFFNHELLSLKMELNKFITFIKDYDKVSFWGIGLEFYNLFVHALPSIRDLEIHLIDTNPGKQKLRVRDIPVQPPPKIASGALISCSLLSGASIKENAMKIGWKEKDIYQISF